MKEHSRLTFVVFFVLVYQHSPSLFKAVHLPDIQTSKVDVHQLAAVVDPTKAAIIIRLLKGYRRLAPTRDLRLPIILPILHKLIIYSFLSISKTFEVSHVFLGMFCLSSFTSGENDYIA